MSDTLEMHCVRYNTQPTRGVQSFRETSDAVNTEPCRIASTTVAAPTQNIPKGAASIKVTKSKTDLARSLLYGRQSGKRVPSTKPVLEEILRRRHAEGLAQDLLSLLVVAWHGVLNG